MLYGVVAAHPELADSPLYITGESYAGHYVRPCPLVSEECIQDLFLGKYFVSNVVMKIKCVIHLFVCTHQIKSHRQDCECQ